MNLREELPEFPITTKWLNGSYTKEQLIGKKPLLIYFWSVSCDACKVAPPLITSWKEKYPNNFNVVAIHMPRSPEDMSKSLVKSTAASAGIMDPICLDHDLAISETYRCKIVPNFYLFDKKGLLRHRQAGERGLQMLEKRLVLLMREN